MDFSDTPAAKARTDRPQLKDFVGSPMRVQAGERKRNQSGDYYYELTFDVRGPDGKPTRYSARTSAYGIMRQMEAITQIGGKLDPQYLPFDARLIMENKSLRFVSLKAEAAQAQETEQGETGA